MKKIDLDNVYFHGIRPPYDETGLTTSNELKILQSILQQGAILCREKQEQLGIKPILNDNLNRNGDDKVSICCSRSDGFFNWVRNHISIILPKDMPECSVEDRLFYGVDGELQVKDFIPLKYFIGIGIPTGTSSFKQIVSEIKCCAQGSEEYFKAHLGNYCNRHITPVREILNNTGYNISLYDIKTGELIQTINELSGSIYHNNEELTL